MAKRKLSVDQRAALRSDLSDGQKAGKAVADLVKESAKKYGIAEITVRWYLNSGKSNGKAKNGRSAGKRRGRPPGRGAAAGNGVGLVGRIVEAFESKVAQTAKRAKKAQRLIPRWRTLVEKKSALEALERKIQKQLSRLAKKAHALGSHIKDLVEG